MYVNVSCVIIRIFSSPDSWEGRLPERRVRAAQHRPQSRPDVWGNINSELQNSICLKSVYHLNDSDGLFLCPGLHLSSVYEVSQLCRGAVQALWAVPRHRRPARSCGPHEVRILMWHELLHHRQNVVFLWTHSVFVYREDLTMLRQEVQDLHASLKVRWSLGSEQRCVNGRFVQRLDCVSAFVCVHLIRRNGGSLENSRRS